MAAMAVVADCWVATAAPAVDCSAADRMIASVVTAAAVACSVVTAAAVACSVVTAAVVACWVATAVAVGCSVVMGWAVVFLADTVARVAAVE